jgi:hypothetical protein
MRSLGARLIALEKMRRFFGGAGVVGKQKECLEKAQKTCNTWIRQSLDSC